MLQDQSQAEVFSEITALRRQAIRAGKAGQSEVAGTLYRQVLALHEQTLGPDHPEIMGSLGDLVFIYGRQDRHEDIGPLILRALAISEANPGPKNRAILHTLDSLASQARDRGNLNHAEHYRRQAIAARQRLLGPDHPRVATSMAALGEVLEAKRDPQAEAERVATAKANVAAALAMFEAARTARRV